MMYRLCLLALLVLVVPSLAQQQVEDGSLALRQQQVSRKQAVGLSALFPGLGQLATGHRSRGTAMVVAEMGFVVIWLTSHADYNTQHEQFKAERQRYLALRDGGSFAQAELSWSQLQDKKDDLDGSHTRRVVFGALSGMLYGYSLLDALFWDGGRMAQVAGWSVEQRTSGLAAVYRF